jgi:hypothetical protein
VLKTALEKTGAAWKIVEERLAKNADSAGKDFTIGDIPLGVWVTAGSSSLSSARSSINRKAQNTTEIVFI